MYEELKFSVVGVSPMLMHNGLLADPQYPWTKEMKAISGKRKKTDADLAEMARVEWFGSLYLNDAGAIVIPGENIERMLIDAAKKNRLGKEATSGIISDGNWPLKFDGPTDPADVYKDGRFTDRRGVKVQASRVIRCRPIFRQWKLDFSVHFLPSILNKSQVVEMVQIAGRIIGIGDYRPKFGRFELAA